MKFTINDIKNQFKERNYVLLDDEYINQKQALHFICNKHKNFGIQTIVYRNLKYKNNGCHCCAKEKFEQNNRTSASEAKKLVEEKGLEFISISYASENNKTYASIKFICPKHRYVGVQETPLYQIKNGKYGCNYCNFVLDTYTFEEKLKERNINYFNVIGKYINQDTPIELQCKRHGFNYFQRPRKIFEGVNSCPECRRESLKTQGLLSLEEAQLKLLKTHPMVHIVGKYKDTFTPVELYCDTHDYEFKCSINNYLYKGKYECCPKCCRTNGESRIIKFLDNLKYEYTQQKTFDNCKDKQLLSFDFYLNDFNTCIEYQGEQHYYSIEHFGGEKRYKRQLLHDEIKREYCINNNINLIEIPYWEKEDLEDFLWNELIKCGVINKMTYN